MMASPTTDVMLAIDAIMARVRARARLLTAWTERLWSVGQTSLDQGLAITPGEVQRILSPPEVEAERYRCFLAEAEPTRLLGAVVSADDALAENAFWSRMVATFGLNAREGDLLCLLVAVELDPRLGRVLAYLADDTRAIHPTAALAAELFEGERFGAERRERKEAPAMPHRMPALLRWRLALPLPGEAAWQAKTAWQMDAAVLLSALAEQWVDPTLDRAARLIQPEEAQRVPCLYPELLARMLALPLEIGKQASIEIALAGPDGSGRETLAAQFAAAKGRPLLAVKTPLLVGATGSDPGTATDALVRVVRLAHTTGAVLYWRDTEFVATADWAEAQALAGLSLRGTREASAAATYCFELKPLATVQRLKLWAHYSQAPIPAIVRMQRLTPAEMRRAAEAGDEAAIAAALRRTTSPGGELMQALPCPYTWDDLVATADLRRTLQDFEAQVRLRWEVYEEWGFARLTHLGQGISALFGGPSGTGKTMAAQVLARSLELELYRVDLAGVVNKYIGETEKRLRDVFDACERSGALLFFDEADALFGSRMQVKDSHDRFANIEIDYLLQRIEQFDGVAILATNRKNDLDAAFLRRLRFVVDFLNPGKEERRALWEKALPPHAPGGERIVGEIDIGMLADHMELNGAQIKSIALGAAFLARSEGTQIGMKQIELAAQREYAKQGLRLRAPFGKSALI